MARCTFIILLMLLACARALAVGCAPHGVQVQVLGSGGPIADDARASSGYLLWVDGRARVLVDVGGGSFLRFGEAGARIEDLDLIALTHLHADHAGDLPTLVKSGYFSDRTRPLSLSGPAAGADFPGLADFLSALFGAEHGAFRYLSGALDGSAGLFRLQAIELATDKSRPQRLASVDGLKIDAIGVSHGPVPALAYRITVRGLRFVFGGDQNGRDPAFWRMAKSANLLVMGLPIPEDADPVARRLHATPSLIAAGAAGAGVRQLLLSHLMARSLSGLPQHLALIQHSYPGLVRVAQDLGCYAGQ